MKHTPWRRTLAAAGAVTGLLALSACGSSAGSEEDEKGGSASGGSFTWTDARGGEVTLDEKPDTVVAQSSVAAALWDAGYEVKGSYGELGELGGKLNYQAGNLDLDELKVLGKTYGEFDEVAYASMDPDLLIDFNMMGKDLWYIPPKEATTIFEIAPALGVPGQDLPDTEAVIEDFVELAEALGGDTDSAEHEEAEEAFDEAVDALEASAKDKADVTVALMSFNADGAYIWNPAMMPEAKTMQAAGIDVITPKNLDPAGFFELLSWEQANKYGADVILSDARTEQFMAQVEKIPTYQQLPAVKAGQVFPWKTAAPYSYAQYGPIFQEIAGWMEDAKQVG